ncbi:hypothetical protein V6K52_16355 [Knoellia sp. S7-12]|uniref:hypothetical protein n=1 Tax=Knoellia sp. S7-12 TaxID=3126698 RepID=UPI003366B14D
MIFPVTRSGRRRADKRSRLPDLSTFSSISRPTAVKSLVGLGLATSVAAALAIPVQAAPEQVELSSQTSALVARDRADAVQGTASRSSARAGVAKAGTSVTAPAAAESVKVAAGPVGVTAVAKPRPKPKPKPKPEQKPEQKSAEPSEKATTKTDESSSSSSSSSSSKSSSSSSSVPSGVGSGAYVGWCSGKGLGNGASTVCSAVRSNFGITNIGGFRAGAGDHGTGKAVDVMVSGSTGDAVAQWATNNMGRLNITYVIWEQRIWLAGSSGWRSMDDRGSVTANHYDHVHISVS